MLTAPSLSVAVAVSVMVAGAVKEAPADGVTMLTLGPTLGGGLTIMVIGLEVVTAPELSVALAVRLKIPVGTALQLMV